MNLAIDILKLLAGGKTAAYFSYVRIHQSSQTPKDHSSTTYLPSLNNEFSDRYFEAARRWQNRSILFVCEDFDSKADAKRSSLKHY